jgi:hypothetical protein
MQGLDGAEGAQLRWGCCLGRCTASQRLGQRPFQPHTREGESQQGARSKETLARDMQSLCQLLSGPQPSAPPDTPFHHGALCVFPNQCALSLSHAPLPVLHKFSSATFTSLLSTLPSPPLTSGHPSHQGHQGMGEPWSCCLPLQLALPAWSCCLPLQLAPPWLLSPSCPLPSSPSLSPLPLLAQEAKSGKVAAEEKEIRLYGGTLFDAASDDKGEYFKKRSLINKMVRGGGGCSSRSLGPAQPPQESHAPQPSPLPLLPLPLTSRTTAWPL